MPAGFDFRGYDPSVFEVDAPPSATVALSDAVVTDLAIADARVTRVALSDALVTAVTLTDALAEGD